MAFDVFLEITINLNECSLFPTIKHFLPQTLALSLLPPQVIFCVVGKRVDRNNNQDKHMIIKVLLVNRVFFGESECVSEIMRAQRDVTRLFFFVYTLSACIHPHFVFRLCACPAQRLADVMGIA